MKQRWTTTVTTATAFLALSAFAGAVPAAAQEAGPAYVALGDSYSSGVGAGDYDAASGDCKRSSHAYAQLWKAAHTPSSFGFTACSGALTSDVINGQLGSLNASTGLVSISIGGNDAGFGDTMSACVLQGEDACLGKVAQAKDYIGKTLPGELDRVYDAIRAKAPSAHVVVLGYPHMYQLDGQCAAGISEASRKAINEASDALDDATAKRAADHGFSFGDVRNTFAGHELCSGDPWLHSVSVPVDQSYHPTAAGQSGGYLPALERAA